jgi:hypothetical protein
LRFTTALERAEALELADVVALAHHGLLACAVAASDLDAALYHGWIAFRNAGDDLTSRAEVLINLSQVCAEAGYHEAALSGNLRAAVLCEKPRLRIPAFGGVAAAAAVLRRWNLVGLAAESLDAMCSEGLLPYETAKAYTALASAYKEKGDRERAARYGAVAHEIGVRHGFFEVVFARDRRETGEGRDASVAPRRRDLAAASIDVVQAIERLPIGDSVVALSTPRGS